MLKWARAFGQTTTFLGVVMIGVIWGGILILANAAHDRACQQDRPDGLGDDGQGRELQGTRRTCGVNEIASDIRRDVKVGKGEQHVMQSRSIRRSGQPTCAIALSNAGF